MADRALTHSLDFEGRRVTAVMFRGRWLWRGAEVGEAIGYEHGRKLVENVRGSWASDFTDGADFLMLSGADLAEFQGALNDFPDRGSHSRGRGGARSMLVLTESGVDLALVLAQTEKGRRLRRFLVDHVLPQLRATGTATIPGAPPPAVDLGALRCLLNELLDERLGRPAAPPRSSDATMLGPRDRAIVLNPVMVLARVTCGPKATEQELASERGAVYERLRVALRWRGRWAFFPEARVGELTAALAGEERIARRSAERAGHAAQLDLFDDRGRPRKRSPRGAKGAN